MKNSLKVGGLYRFLMDKDLLARVLCFDDEIVLYDSKFKHYKWTFADDKLYLKSKCIYYRIPTFLFHNRTEYEDISEVSKEEMMVYRPDLPLSLLKKKSNGEDIFKSFSIEELEEKVDTSKIFIHPLDSKDNLRRGVLVESKKEEKLRKRDILNKMIEVKQKYFDDIISIGLYRVGSQKGIPSFYVGEYNDMEEYLGKVEKESSNT